MTAQQVYALTPESTSKDLGCLKGCYYDHIPEVQATLYMLTQDRVELRFIKDFCYDGRRIWRLCTVWLDDKPVMIIQNAGREGNDHHERFITDLQLYKELVSYIHSLIIEVSDCVAVTPLDVDMPELTKFYRQSLTDPFDLITY